MRTTVFAILLTALAQVVSAADTAYTALRVIGREQGEGALNRVLEVRGRFGAPQPQVWKVTLQESGARGGLRELEIQRGKVISERTPVSRGLAGAMNFNQLNLDSDGVFTVANQEAQKASVTFDRADFILRSGTQGGAPVWTVEFYEGRNGKVGTFEIAADSGTVLRKELARDHRQDVARADREFLKEEEDKGPRPDVEEWDESDDPRDVRQYGRESRGGVSGFFGRVEKHFKKRGRQFENFFTGRGFHEE
ncbi:hypothetical protein ACXR0O_27675 [Verrucomicrobiota bacterium sgz303538]